MEKHLHDWFRDAHAMEQQAEKMLKAQAGRLESYPELRRRIEEHLRETQHQSERLEHCMALMNIDTSILKDIGAKASAFGQAISGVMASDEVLKGSIACYAFENFEIANYKVLIKAAQVLKQEEVARICTEILQEEQAMADWLSQHLEDTTQRFLERSESDELRSKS